MNAAQKLFIEQGVPGTTIEQIALGADLSKGAFYLHFASKEEIHLALCERFCRHYSVTVREAIAKRPKKDWRGKVAAWARASTTGLLDHGDLVNMLFHVHPIPADTGWDEIVVKPLLELLDAGMQQGAWELSDSRFTATFLFSGLHGVVDDALMSKGRISRAQVIREMEAACMTALKLGLR